MPSDEDEWSSPDDKIPLEETPDALLVASAKMDDLHRVAHAARDVTAVEDAAHPAASDLARDLVGADPHRPEVDAPAARRPAVTGASPAATPPSAA